MSGEKKTTIFRDGKFICEPSPEWLKTLLADKTEFDWEKLLEKHGLHKIGGGRYAREYSPFDIELYRRKDDGSYLADVWGGDGQLAIVILPDEAALINFSLNYCAAIARSENIEKIAESLEKLSNVALSLGRYYCGQRLTDDGEHFTDIRKRQEAAAAIRRAEKKEPTP